MSLGSLFNKFKTVVAQKYGKDPGKMLIHTGVIGWVFFISGTGCSNCNQR